MTEQQADKPVTPERQAALDAAHRVLELAEKATPGPWGVFEKTNIHTVGKLGEPPGQFDIAETFVAKSPEDQAVSDGIADAAFIAEVRTLAPQIAQALIDGLRRHCMTALEARLRALKHNDYLGSRGGWDAKKFAWDEAIDAALAEAAKEPDLDDPAPPSEEEVERVARAMFDVDLPLARTPAWSDRLVLARAAIKAMREGEQ